MKELERFTYTVCIILAFMTAPTIIGPIIFLSIARGFEGK